MTLYQYLVFQADMVRAVFSLGHHPDSYISSEPATDSLREAVRMGFRWVRTDGEWAVFEKEYRDIPNKVKEMLDANERTPPGAG